VPPLAEVMTKLPVLTSALYVVPFFDDGSFPVAIFVQVGNTSDGMELPRRFGTVWIMDCIPFECTGTDTAGTIFVTSGS